MEKVESLSSEPVVLERLASIRSSDRVNCHSLTVYLTNSTEEIEVFHYGFQAMAKLPANLVKFESESQIVDLLFKGKTVTLQFYDRSDRNTALIHTATVYPKYEDRIYVIHRRDSGCSISMEPLSNVLESYSNTDLLIEVGYK